MAVNLTPAVLSGRNPYPAEMRTGTVVNSDASRVEVLVGGTRIFAAYLDSYVPAPADLVALVRQDFTWLVVGRYAGAGPNLVPNPSFENSPPGIGNPVSWFTAPFGGGAATTVSVVESEDAASGSQVLQHDPPGAARETISYCTPFGIAAGRTYSLSVYVGGIAQPSGGYTVDARLYGLWFTDGETSYPSPTQPIDETIAAEMLNVPNVPPMILMSGTVVAPPSAQTMAIGLRSSLGINVGMQWDLAVVREAPGV